MSTRMWYFDNLKYILITLVVVGHFLSVFHVQNQSEQAFLVAVKETIWIFHMPAFLFVSGLFAKRMFTKENGLNVNSIAFLLVLYILFYTVLFIIYPTKLFNPFDVVRVPWYLLAMAILGASTAIVYSIRLGAKVVIPASIIMSIVSGFYTDFSSFLSLGRIVNFAPFYYIGYYVSIQGFQDFITKLKKSKVVLLGSVLSIVSVCFIMYLAPQLYSQALFRISQGCYAYVDCGDMSLLALVALRIIWFVMAALLGLCVCVIAPSGECFISKLGSRTLQVYILHAFVYYPMIRLNAAAFYSDLNLPIAGLWVVLFGVFLTWVLSVWSAPDKFFKFLKSKIRLAD